jgi:hypothetical protein
MTGDRGIHWPRAALLALLLWWTIRLGSGAATWCFVDFVNLAFHEFGHLLFRPLGMTLHYLGGTLFQLLVPAMLVVYFLIRRAEPSGSAFCLWWVGESLINISVYMADARELNLPLVGGGDHDWNELFYRFGLLGEESVARVSGFTHGLGVVIMLGGLLWWTYFVLPTRIQRRVHDAITSRSPALELLFPYPDQTV